MWKKLGLDVSIHDITGMGSTNAMLAGSVDFTVQSGPSLVSRQYPRPSYDRASPKWRRQRAFALVGRKASSPGSIVRARSRERVATVKGKKVSTECAEHGDRRIAALFVGKAGLNSEDRHHRVLYATDRGDRGAEVGRGRRCDAQLSLGRTAEREGPMLLVNAGDRRAGAACRPSPRPPRRERTIAMSCIDLRPSSCMAMCWRTSSSTSIPTRRCRSR